MPSDNEPKRQRHGRVPLCEVARGFADRPPAVIGPPGYLGPTMPWTGVQSVGTCALLGAPEAHGNHEPGCEDQEAPACLAAHDQAGEGRNG